MGKEKNTRATTPTVTEWRAIDDGEFLAALSPNGHWYLFGAGGQWREADGAVTRAIMDGWDDLLTPEQGLTRLAELGGSLEDLPN